MMEMIVALGQADGAVRAGGQRAGL
jgi:hypothetical protein